MTRAQSSAVTLEPEAPQTAGTRVFAFEWVALDTLGKQPLKDALACWSRLRGERSFPTRNDLKVREIAALLPYISLLKVIDDGADFEHRIVGDTLVRTLDVPIQNRRFSDIASDAPGFSYVSVQLFRKAFEARAPLAWRHHTSSDESHVVFTETNVLALPLSNDGGTIDHLAVFAVYEHRTSPSSQPN